MAPMIVTPRWGSYGDPMCGRFVISKFPADVARWFGTTGPLPNSRPRYNVAPTDQVAVARFNAETKQRTLDTLRWGLVPYWAKDVRIGATMINAKAETVAEKPAFREAFKSRRSDPRRWSLRMGRTRCEDQATLRHP